MDKIWLWWSLPSDLLRIMGTGSSSTAPLPVDGPCAHYACDTHRGAQPTTHKEHGNAFTDCRCLGPVHSYEMIWDRPQACDVMYI